ncbi:MAG: TolC family protein [Pseudomonadota bacterium]
MQLLPCVVRGLRTTPLALAVLAASAQVSPSGAPALRAAADAAWQRAVQAAEAEGQALRADASRVAAAGLLPAPPAIELSHRNERWTDRAPGAGRETELAAALPLWTPGQRAARATAADAEAASARAALHFARWQIAGQVRELAWRIASARAELRHAMARQEALERLAADVDRRVKAGDLARADALAARAEALSARGQAAEAQWQLDTAERDWAAQVALPVPEPAQMEEALPTGAGRLDLEQHPQLQLAMRQLELAQRQQAAVAADRRDPPELLLRYRQETAGTDAGTRNSVGVGLRIPLGTDARNRPLDAAAASAALVAQRQLEAARLQLVSALKQAQDAHAAAARRLSAARERAALERERAALVQRAFDAGEYGLPDLLRALAASAAAQADLERTQAALGLARARLLQAQGLTP